MSATAEVIPAKVTRILDLPPSCAQFCPLHPQHFVIGTYNLNKGEGEAAGAVGAESASDGGIRTQNRDGSLVVFKTDGNDLCHIGTLMQPSAILDIRFHRHKGTQDVLAVISSTATLAIFKLAPEDAQPPLQHIATSRCEDVGEDVLFLQCQWHPRNPKVLGVTLSTGQARLLHLNEQWEIDGFVDLDIGNSLEAWCIEFSPVLSEDDDEETTTVYCGGDDSILRFTSCSISSSSNLATYEPTYPPASIKGQHNAGVTAILSLGFLDEEGGRLVVTGSYDDQVRLFSIRDPHKSHGMKRVQLMREQHLDGGVWRLDLVDLECCDIKGSRVRMVASCMYAGARLIELRKSIVSTQWEFHVLGRFEEHASMNYACCVFQGPRGRHHYISTSFYDKRLCLWDYDYNKPE